MERLGANQRAGLGNENKRAEGGEMHKNEESWRKKKKELKGEEKASREGRGRRGVGGKKSPGWNARGCWSNKGGEGGRAS